MDNVFFVETEYQLLVTVNIIATSEYINRDCIIIDSTRESIAYNYRHLFLEFNNTRVLRVDACNYYVSIFFLWANLRKISVDFSRSKFFYFSNRSPLANKISSLCNVKNNFMVEEGLSIYRKGNDNPLGNRIKKVIKESVISVLTLCRYYDDFGKTKYTKNIILRKDHPDPAFNFDNITYLPTWNDFLVRAPFIREVYFNQCTELLSEDKPKVVFFGQPLSELNIIDKEIEYDLLKKLYECFLNSDIDFVVKEHPRDTPGKYDFLDCHIIPGNLPSEVIFSEGNMIKASMSFYSTAAINLGEQIDIPIIFLHKLLGDIPFQLEIPKSVISFNELNNEFIQYMQTI